MKREIQVRLSRMSSFIDLTEAAGAPQDCSATVSRLDRQETTGWLRLYVPSRMPLERC